MKKNIVFIIILITIFSVAVAAILNIKKINKNNGEKIEIMATLYPQYDFAKQIGGDKVNVTLMLPPGTESHTYEPTPQDMVKVNNSDLFIYTGKEMEPWADNLISGMKENIKVLDLSSKVSLINSEEFEHKHEEEGEEENEDEHEHEHEHESEDEHHHTYDPHIWLNPQYAIKMAEAIRDELCNVDPDNAEYYKQNAENYIKEISTLDEEFESTVKKTNSKKIAFGGAFAYAYFVERYDLEFESAYDACGESTEPSTAKVKKVIDYINKNKIPVIFYKEYSTGNIAKTISEATGAEMLVFNTAHNVSKKEIEEGVTYVDIMKQNLQNLKKALKVE